MCWVLCNTSLVSKLLIHGDWLPIVRVWVVLSKAAIFKVLRTASGN